MKKTFRSEHLCERMELVIKVFCSTDSCVDTKKEHFLTKSIHGYKTFRPITCSIEWQQPAQHGI